VKLKKGVTWHDGKPFTPDDMIFNWEYAVDPATAAVSAGLHKEAGRAGTADRATAAAPARPGSSRRATSPDTSR
jgi:ABC-type transport system substrate-binding protein